MLYVPTRTNNLLYFILLFVKYIVGIYVYVGKIHSTM